MSDLSNSVQRVSDVSYANFRKDHLLPNQPLLIGTDLIEAWPCLNHWRAANSPFHLSGRPAAEMETMRSNAFSTPNLTYIRSKYGGFTVPVDEDGCRSERPLHEIIDIWEGKDGSRGSDQGAKIYVKDWHLALQLEKESARAGPTASLDEDCTFYTTPDIFADDWMNLYYRKNTDDDFRFVYMGPAGTFTRLHRDVYTSYSWSTNVVGRKRWWLFPPSVTPHITKSNGETVADGWLLGTPFDPDAVDAAIWPDWNVAKQAMHVVEQEEGETIFVPSGWYHQVLNLTFCVSINHNWSNAHNLTSMYYSMVDAVGRVETSIEDVKGLLQKRLPADEWETEWRKVVQDLLRQDAGWDWSTFLGMVLLGLEDCLAQEGLSQSNDDAREPGSDIHTTPNPCDAPSQSQHSDQSFSEITPDRRYVLDQASPCIAHFTASSWGQSGEYEGLLSRIRRLISQ